MKVSSQDSALSVIAFLNSLGKSAIDLVNISARNDLFQQIVHHDLRSKQLPEIIQQVYYIGARSSNIVMLVGLFTGMVLGLQLYYVLAKLGSEGLLGSVIALALIRNWGLYWQPS